MLSLFLLVKKILVLNIKKVSNYNSKRLPLKFNEYLHHQIIKTNN
ncbi:hypothetical protein SAMN05421766_11165 [Zobellia uliginosa]|uniref:Uncharacterized protein n=1 Tax=Zobellia uliginosa TaxID=143224 RepID=A0ABY1L287_9FLAO|nr:hypothetical protein SAMN05421766_11165 [Zobellia uliginosa]